MDADAVMRLTDAASFVPSVVIQVSAESEPLRRPLQKGRNDRRISSFGSRILSKI
jgi:hypothetical protein